MPALHRRECAGHHSLASSAHVRHGQHSTLEAGKSQMPMNGVPAPRRGWPVQCAARASSLG